MLGVEIVMVGEREREGWGGVVGRNKVEQEMKREGRAKYTETEKNRGEEVGRTGRERWGRGRRQKGQRVRWKGV